MCALMSQCAGIPKSLPLAQSYTASDSSSTPGTTYCSGYGREAQRTGLLLSSPPLWRPLDIRCGMGKMSLTIVDSPEALGTPRERV